LNQNTSVRKASELLQEISLKIKEFSQLVKIDNESPDVDTRSLQVYFKMLDEQYMQDLIKKITYINYPIITEGFLHRNENGRYEVNGIELTSGDPIEILRDDTYYATFIDYAGQYGGGYYAFHFPNFVLEGAKVRVRGNPHYTKSKIRPNTKI